MENSAVLELFNSLPKSALIKAFRHKLREEGKLMKHGIRRTKLHGQNISWNEFRRTKKELVMVHIFTEGCDADYLQKLVADGFFDKPAPIEENEENKFVYYPVWSKSGEKRPKMSGRGYHWCNASCCKDFSSRDYITYKEKIENEKARFKNNIASQRGLEHEGQEQT